MFKFFLYYLFNNFIIIYIIYKKPILKVLYYLNLLLKNALKIKFIVLDFLVKVIYIIKFNISCSI